MDTGRRLVIPFRWSRRLGASLASAEGDAGGSEPPPVTQLATGSAEREAAVLAKAKELLRVLKTVDSPLNEEATSVILHNLAYIFEKEEGRYLELVGDPYSHQRSNFTIGKLINLVKDNDEFFHKYAGEYLHGRAYSHRLRAASARLSLVLLQCLQQLQFPFTDEVAVQRLRDLVRDGLQLRLAAVTTRATGRAQGAPPGAPLTSPRHAARSSGALSSSAGGSQPSVRAGASGERPAESSVDVRTADPDEERVWTYSLGLLAIALTSEEVADDVVRSGMVHTLAQYLRHAVLSGAHAVPPEPDGSAAGGTTATGAGEGSRGGRMPAKDAAGASSTHTLRGRGGIGSPDKPTATHGVAGVGASLTPGSSARERTAGGAGAAGRPAKVPALPSAGTPDAKAGPTRIKPARACERAAAGASSMEVEPPAGEGLPVVEIRSNEGGNAAGPYEGGGAAGWSSGVPGGSQATDGISQVGHGEATGGGDTALVPAGYDAPAVDAVAVGSSHQESITTRAPGGGALPHGDAGGVVAASSSAAVPGAVGGITPDPDADDSGRWGYLQLLYLIQCLGSMGEYMEALGPVLQENGLEVVLCLLRRPAASAFSPSSLDDMVLLSHTLRLTCALLAHRKFATLLVDKGGVQALLACPRNCHTYNPFALCLLGFGALSSVMERVCMLPAPLCGEMVSAALTVLACPQDPARKNILQFFTSAFPFRPLLESFDEQDGLRKLMNALRQATHFGVRPEMTSSERQLMFYGCRAVRQYLRVHLVLLIESLRPSRKGASKAALGGKAYRPVDVSNEAVDGAIKAAETDRRLAVPLLRARWPVMDRFLEVGGHSLMLEMTQTPAAERYSVEVTQDALGALHVATLLPTSHTAVAGGLLTNNKRGMAAILECASPPPGYVGTDPEIIRLALLVLANLVSPPPLLLAAPKVEPPHGAAARTGGSATHAATTAGGPSAQAPAGGAGSSGPVTDSTTPRRGSVAPLGGAGGAPLSSAVSVLSAEGPYRVSRECLRANNGIKVLLSLLQFRNPASAADTIRALACRVLLGLARDPAIAHILNKLQIGKVLSELMREPLPGRGGGGFAYGGGSGGAGAAGGSEFNRWALELIAATTSAGKTAAISSDAAAPAMHKIERAVIAASTPISYPARDLLILIYDHLVASGLHVAAATLAEESGLVGVLPAGTGGQVAGIPGTASSLHSLPATPGATPILARALHPPMMPHAPPGASLVGVQTPTAQLPSLQGLVHHQQQSLLQRGGAPGSEGAHTWPSRGWSSWSCYRSKNGTGGAQGAHHAARDSRACHRHHRFGPGGEDLVSNGGGAAHNGAAGGGVLSAALLSAIRAGGDREGGFAREAAGGAREASGGSGRDLSSSAAAGGGGAIGMDMATPRVRSAHKRRASSPPHEDAPAQSKPRHASHVAQALAGAAGNGATPLLPRGDAGVGAWGALQPLHPSMSPPSAQGGAGTSRAPSGGETAATDASGRVANGALATAGGCRGDDCAAPPASPAPHSLSRALTGAAGAPPGTPAFFSGSTPSLAASSTAAGAAAGALLSSSASAFASGDGSGCGVASVLDRMVVQLLKQQHAACAAPFATLPPLSLLGGPHSCPEPRLRLLDAPTNVAPRLAAREWSPPYGGGGGRRADRHFIYSRYRPWRLYRDDDPAMFTSLCFLGQGARHLAVGNDEGEVRVFACASGDVCAVLPGYSSAITLLQAHRGSPVASGGASTSGGGGNLGEDTGANVDGANLRWDASMGMLLSSTTSCVKLWSGQRGRAPERPLYSFEGARMGRFNHAGDRIVATSSVPNVSEAMIYDVATGATLIKLTSAGDAAPPGGGRSSGRVPISAHFSPSDDLLLWGVTLWDPRVPRAVHRFDQFSDLSAGSGVFHPSGNEAIINSVGPAPLQAAALGALSGRLGHPLQRRRRRHLRDAAPQAGRLRQLEPAPMAAAPAAQLLPHD
eukprot:jgi/Mesvir1/12426/Mv00591-RA.2